MHLTLVYVTLFLKRFLPFDCRSLILEDMAKQSLCVCFAVIVISAILVSEAGAFTDPRDGTILPFFLLDFLGVLYGVFFTVKVDR